MHKKNFFDFYNSVPMMIHHDCISPTWRRESMLDSKNCKFANCPEEAFIAIDGHWWKSMDYHELPEG